MNRRTTVLVIVAMAALLAAIVMIQLRATRNTVVEVLRLPAPYDVDATIDGITKAVPKAMATARVPGAAVGLVIDGRVRWTGVFGTVRDGGTAVTPTTRFRLGSATMPISAAAVVDVARARGLDLDAPARERDPDTVTLAALLANTAPRDVAPADAYGRAPAGYAIAASVASFHAGAPWPTVVHERVLDPRDMANTSARCADAAPLHDANGAPIAAPTPTRAADDLCTTVADAAGFVAWLVSDDDTALALRTPRSGTPDRALGLTAATPGEGITVGHDAATDGLFVRILTNPRDKVGLVVLTNGGGGRLVADAAMQELAQ